MNKPSGMRIKELENRSGVPRTTIHFYIRHGLLHAPAKTGRTMAYYDESHLEKLLVIERIKQDGRAPLALLKKQTEKYEEERRSNGGHEMTALPNKVRTTREKDEKRREIVKAAIRCFSRNGYHNTKVQDITKSIGISTGTFYIYFKNKRDIFVEVIDEIFSTIVGDAAEAIKQANGPLEKLIVRGEVFYKNYSKYDEILHQIRSEMAGEDNWPRTRIKTAYKELTTPVIREIENGIKQGLWREVDAELAAYALTGLVEIMSLRLKLDNKYCHEDVMMFIFDLVSKGFAGPNFGTDKDTG